MGLRITTWNVNGIRNPFGYQPWRDRRTFEGMFDILEADIVVLQETKIQRKDLRDDMVLVPGWDCYWSLPKHKKGYSGVVIYTRNSTCAPIRAEEGITGILTPPNSSTSFKDLPDSDRVGGYPNTEQLSLLEVDATTLDSEGRCVILEFPAFVIIGTYCPANRDETRDEFRLGFLNVLDARIRNLIAMGKQVIWTGDLNISANELDTAAAEEAMRKSGSDGYEYVSTPARRLFNQLLVGGKVFGERDEGREAPVMWDICRGFHEGRKGMFTCWETKINARPGNFGARIDYVLCSAGMKDWFCESDIQEGLMGSDHCPVYAVLKDKVTMDDQETHISDVVNPRGMFQDGKRKQEWTMKNLLAMSGKLIPEFDRRRNIRDMFSRKPSLSSQSSLADSEEPAITSSTISAAMAPPSLSNDPSGSLQSKQDGNVGKLTGPVTSPARIAGSKRTQKSEISAPTAKRAKSGSQAGFTTGSGKGQQSLKGFFAPKAVLVNDSSHVIGTPAEPASELLAISSPVVGMVEAMNEKSPSTSFDSQRSPSATAGNSTLLPAIDEATAEASKQSWGKLFTKPASPKCEHDEPCKTMLTKKPGINCGRSFWMCNRPLGPSGNKEKRTEWRCSTFIWASDWTGNPND